jgi:hypothetical protein
MLSFPSVTGHVQVQKEVLQFASTGYFKIQKVGLLNILGAQQTMAKIIFVTNKFGHSLR